MSKGDGGVLVALSEAAKRLDVSGTTVKQWLKAGKLRGRRFGGEIYISAQEIEALACVNGDGDPPHRTIC